MCYFAFMDLLFNNAEDNASIIETMQIPIIFILYNQVFGMQIILCGDLKRLRGMKNLKTRDNLIS